MKIKYIIVITIQICIIAKSINSAELITPVIRLGGWTIGTKTTEPLGTTGDNLITKGIKNYGCIYSSFQQSITKNAIEVYYWIKTVRKDFGDYLKRTYTRDKFEQGLKGDREYQEFLAKYLENGIYKGKFRIIAHSMGGLVAREYLRLYPNEHSIERLVTLGTPHKGADLAYALDRMKYTVTIGFGLYVTGLALGNIQFITWGGSIVGSASFLSAYFNANGFDFSGEAKEQMKPNSKFLETLNNEKYIPELDEEYRLVAGMGHESSAYILAPIMMIVARGTLPYALINGDDVVEKNSQIALGVPIVGNSTKYYVDSNHFKFEDHFDTILKALMDPSNIFASSLNQTPIGNTGGVTYKSASVGERVNDGFKVELDGKEYDASDITATEIPTEIKGKIKDYLPHLLKETKVSINFAPYEALNVDSQGNWTIKNPALDEGQNIIRIYVKNAADYETTQQSRITIKTLPLGITPIYPWNGLSINKTKPEIHAEITRETYGIPSPTGDEIDKTFIIDGNNKTNDVTLEKNGVAYTLKYTPPAPLEQGEHKVEVKVKDNTFREESKTVWSFWIDQQPPTISITQPTGPFSPSVTNNINVDYNISDNISKIVKNIVFKINGVKYDEISNKPTGKFYFQWEPVDIPDGDYILTITTKDQVGNNRVKSKMRNLI